MGAAENGGNSAGGVRSSSFGGDNAAGVASSIAAVSCGSTGGSEACGGSLQKTGIHEAQRCVDDVRHEAVGAYMSPLTPCLALEAPAAPCTPAEGGEAPSSHLPPGLEHPAWQPDAHSVLGCPQLASESLPSCFPVLSSPAAPPSVTSLCLRTPPGNAPASQQSMLAGIETSRKLQSRRALHRLKCSCGAAFVAGSVAKKSVDCSVCGVVIPHGRQAYSCDSCCRRICKSCHRNGRIAGCGGSSYTRTGEGPMPARAVGPLTVGMVQQASESLNTQNAQGRTGAHVAETTGYIPGFAHDCMQANRRIGESAAASRPLAAGERAGIGTATRARAVGEGQDAASDSNAAEDDGAVAEELESGAGEERGWQRSMQVLVWDPVAIHELQGMPLVYAKAPLLWIPRALRERVCAVLCGLLHDAVQPRDAELANLLLFHSGQLLLRIPAQETAEENENATTTGAPEREPVRQGDESAVEGASSKMQGIVAQVRERVALAGKGAWGQLAHALYIEIQEAAGRSRPMQREDVAGPNALALADAPARGTRLGHEDTRKSST